MLDDRYYYIITYIVVSSLEKEVKQGGRGQDRGRSCAHHNTNLRVDRRAASASQTVRFVVGIVN